MAETVYIRGENGSVIPHDLPLPLGIQDRLDRGYLQLVELEVDPADDAPQLERPAASALKADWVAYAVAIDPDLKPDDADAMTKADLVAKYGDK